MMRDRLPIMAAIVALAAALPISDAGAQQLPPSMRQQAPRPPLAPGSKETLPDSTSEKMRTPGQPDSSSAKDITAAKQLALNTLTSANARVLSPNAILLVKAGAGSLNLEYDRRGTWTAVVLQPYEAKEIVCAECGPQIKLRFHDTKEVQTLSFDLGARVAFLWAAAISRYQALPTSQAQTTLTNPR
jgi:hypothetical protein